MIFKSKLFVSKNKTEIINLCNTFVPNKILIASVSFNFIEGINISLKRGANILYDDNYAFLKAVYLGHIDVVNILIKYGCNIYARQHYALHLAANRDHYDILKLLLEMGLNPNGICPSFKYIDYSSKIVWLLNKYKYNNYK